MRTTGLCGLVIGEVVLWLFGVLSRAESLHIIRAG
jgi:hypothetical protein